MDIIRVDKSMPTLHPCYHPSLLTHILAITLFITLTVIHSCYHTIIHHPCYHPFLLSHSFAITLFITLAITLFITLAISLSSRGGFDLVSAFWGYLILITWTAIILPLNLLIINFFLSKSWTEKVLYTVFPRLQRLCRGLNTVPVSYLFLSGCSISIVCLSVGWLGILYHYCTF